MRSLLLAVLLASCVVDPTVPCGELACPAESVCTVVGCASSEQVSVCMGIAEGNACATPGFANGSCVSGVCLELACGDGRTIVPEVCDDGNQRSGDGCSADCRSVETCGNGYADTLVGEQCDDGLFGRSGDGCSSLCKAEVPIWQSEASAAPGARGGHALASDTDRRRIVAYGGRDRSNVTLADTWELDGTTWRALRPIHSPPPLLGHAMAYDERRRRTVLFGGYTFPSAPPLGETWEWDGVDWERVPLELSPPARFGAAMAFDRGRGEIVLVGGIPGEDATVPDTWSYDGSRWAPIPTTGLPTTTWSALVYDSVEERLVYTNGRAMYVLSGATWTELPTAMPVIEDPPALAMGDDAIIMRAGRFSYALRGTTWGPRQAITSLPLSTAPLATDGRRVVSYGGNDLSTCEPGACFPPVDLTFELRSAQWRPLPAPTPMARGAAIVFDPYRGAVLSIGGADGTVSMPVGTDETRVWRDGSWSVLPGAATVNYASGRAVATPRGIVLVTYEDSMLVTRLLADGTWTEESQAGPPPRVQFQLVYRAATDTIVMHGGILPGIGPISDTWELGPDGWVERTGSAPPPHRDNPLVAYDRARDRVILFGGYDMALLDVVDELWEWDGSEWMLLPSDGGPSARSRVFGGYDPARRRLLVAGGSGLAGPVRDAWEWDGSAWTSVESPTSAPAPDREVNVISTYDEINRRLLVIEPTRWSSLSYTSSLSPRDRCSDVDTDGDALVGCADPDCAARCATCGDGACDPLEDRRLCAADCE